MSKLRSVFTLFSLLLLFSSAALVAAQGSRRGRSQWQTLSGDAPLVIARGGFSGIFPDSSVYAYSLAVQTGLRTLLAWCDVQLTRDGVGICIPDLRLENASDIDNVYGNRRNTYNVNGVRTQGWFSVDFTLDELTPVNMKQRIYSRAPNFDGTPMQILTVEDVVSLAKPPGLWLNIPHDAFFSQHNLSMRSYVLSVSRRVIVNYVSSPEVGFLRSVVSRLGTGPTKLVLQFLRPDDVELTTNQTYGSLLRNLTLIRSFARGIIVPKYYIWPVDSSQYVQNYTSLVLDAHRAGLEVFASNFANDASIPYDHSYDPVAEYLSYIDNGVFSVDGVISDFPLTPSATIDCFSHMGRNETVQASVLVISSEGASGTYPGCTDTAYENAVSDGVDILDCPVQMSYDGVPFCLGSINLRDRTDVAQSDFSDLATNNPDLNIDDGIFAYNLTWSQIQTLRPAISNPYTNFSLFRNPRARNNGSLMQLSDFLAFANNASSVSGVLISIENAAYLAQSQGLGVTDAVLDALSAAGYNNHTTKTVMIKSSDSAVLTRFRSRSNYTLVYVVDEDVRDITNSTIMEIRRFASSVVLSKRSVFPTDRAFLTGETNIVPKLQAFNLTVYAQLFRNEFVSQPWDFFSDAYVEINTHVQYMGINGIITEFPATAAKYKRNRCLGYRDLPVYMTPVQPGGLIPLMANNYLPPAEAPNPILTENDVVEPPLPAVVDRPSTGTTGNGTTAPGPASPNGQPTLVASSVLSGIAMVLAAVVLSWG
ncbi:hypothetical protein BUALT_Bualt18G0071800 [Buddleja alternifolia]|uniref:glycerophosphodiester phosphodiesterase n=1 Tax=Buddleja alternifolia TaxID=168488 RepID=A0AAV6WDT2_9LAMI|nr:hypothetical protein BUALT_Bualt18G0071800 [Buddleja alternifolia]